MVFKAVKLAQLLYGAYILIVTFTYAGKLAPLVVPEIQSRASSLILLQRKIPTPEWFFRMTIYVP